MVYMSKDEFILHDWEWEKMAQLKEAEEKLYYENMVQEGIKNGFEQGIEQGIEQGKKSEKEEIVKKMLKNNLDYKTISNVTGKSIKEIKEIEKSLNKD